MEFNRWKFEETINSLEYEIYSAKRPKEYVYKVMPKDSVGGFWRDDTDFPTREAAMKHLKKMAPAKEKGPDGKTHHYRQYTCHRGDSVTLEREEYVVVKTDKYFRPEYSGKVLSEMRRCLKKMKEAMVCAENTMRLVNGDCGGETFIRDVKRDLEKLKTEPLVRDMKELDYDVD